MPPGEPFRDCADCPEMLIVPAGSFQMGDLSGTGDSDEAPVHKVTIPRAFAVGKYEVTRQEYARFTRSTGRSSGDGCYVYDGMDWSKEPSLSWQNPGYNQTDRDPVSCVNWGDAKAYVSWLGDKTGKPYRLLNESEWEYVARAGSTGDYSFGDLVSSLCRHGNGADSSAGFKFWHGDGADSGAGFKLKNSSCSDGYGETTAPVGSFAANAFGVHDMHGNVWEWTEDCSTKDYRGAPDRGQAQTAGDCSFRVVRGGSWVNRPKNLRAAERGIHYVANRSGNLGFRVARSL